MTLFSLILLIFLAQSTNCFSAYSKTFPDLIETGISTFMQGQKSLGTRGITCPLDFQIVFQTRKSTTNYDQTLSIQDLNLQHYSDGFAFNIGAVELKATSLKSRVSFCSSYLKLLKIRYLIVLPAVFNVVQIVHINKSYSTALPVEDNVSYITIIDNSFSVIASQTSTSVILKGFKADTINPHSIHLLVTYELQNTSIKIYVKGQVYRYTISYLGFSVILINNNIPINGIVGSFQIYHSQVTRYNSSVTVTDTNSLFSTTTTFLGIKNFKYVVGSAGLKFQFTISSSNIKFDASYNIAYQIQIINFVYIICTTATPLYYPADNICYAACPSPSLTSSSNPYLCSLCSSNCDSCVDSANCTTCADGFYNNAWTCSACNTGCATCNTSSDCSTCADRYYSQGSSCTINCTLQEQCNSCNMNNSNIFCTNCSQGYSVSDGFCVPQCGDGILIGFQMCDDGNLGNGDGCSSECIIQDFFNCTTANNTLNASYIHSQCSLSNLSINYLYAVKGEGANTFTAFFTATPNILTLPSLDWLSGLSFGQNIIITSFSIDSTGKMQIQAEYSSDLTGEEITLEANYSNMGPIAKLSLTQSLSQRISAENNLSLKNYPANVYNLEQAIKYFCYILSAISLLLLLAGYFGGKLIALEHIAVLQVIGLCMVSVHEASPTFSGLRSLRLSMGIVPLAPYDYSSSVSRELKGVLYNPNALININFGLLFVFLPPLAALVCKILSLTICKENATLGKVWPLLVGQNTLFGLLICAYAIFSQFVFELLVMFQGGNSDNDGLIIGIASMSCLILLILTYSILMYKLPRFFGQFKKKFEKYNSNTYFYIYIIFERFLSSLVIVLLRNLQFGLIFQFMIIGSLFAFVAVKNPYICGDYQRPLINFAASGLCIALICLNNILPSVQLFAMYVPIAICFLLAMLTCKNIYNLVLELRELYPSKSLNATKDSKDFFDQVLRFQGPEEIEQKNRFQLDGFRKQFFDDHEEIVFQQKENQCNKKKIKQNLNEEWSKYAILSNSRLIGQTNNSVLDQIKEKQISTINEEDYQ